MTDLPVLGVTMGDPSGSGSEIVAKAWADPEVRRFAAAGEDFIVAHVGNLYGGRDPRLLFRAVHRVLERSMNRVVALKVMNPGTVTPEDLSWTSWFSTSRSVMRTSNLGAC